MVQLYVLALLISDNRMLLARRIGADFGDQLYSLVGGKVERNETALHAIRREVREETGLDIPEQRFTLVHTLHRKGTENPFIALCFMVDISSLGVPRNTEPHKHDDLRFFSPLMLPDAMIPAHRQIVSCIQTATFYSEHGWNE